MEKVDEWCVRGAGVIVLDHVAVVLDERKAGDAFEDVREEAAVDVGAGVVDSVLLDVLLVLPAQDGEADGLIHVWRAEEEVLEELRDRAVVQLGWDGVCHSRLEDAGGGVEEQFSEFDGVYGPLGILQCGVNTGFALGILFTLRLCDVAGLAGAVDCIQVSD